MEVRSWSGPGCRGRVWGREAPGTAGGPTVETPTFVIPLARACIAVVRMELSDEQVLASGAHRTIPFADECEVPGLRIVDRYLTDEGRRPRMLPPVALTASMGMLGVPATHQRLARRSLSTTASLPGASSNAR